MLEKVRRLYTRMYVQYEMFIVSIYKIELTFEECKREYIAQTHV